MEYVYGALLLHSVGKEINEENLKKVMKATGAKVDDAMIKAVVSSLKDVDINEAIKSASPIMTQPVVTQAEQKPEEKAEEKKEEKKAEEEEKAEEEAAAGLASLFG